MISNSALPFAMPSSDVFFASPKKVFAHYFRSFGLSIDNQPATTDYYNMQFLSIGGENGKHAAYGGYLRQRSLPVTPSILATWKQFNMETEVQMAVARGITGFCFDILSLTDGFLQTMLSAGEAADPRFTIIPMLDMRSLGAITVAQAATYLESIASSPALKRLPDGRLVLAAYNAPLQPPSWWLSLIETLNAQGINVAFVPVLPGAPADAGALNAISYGTGGWGTATPAPSAALTAAGAHLAGLKYMSPVIPQQFRPKNQIFWEASNSVTFRNAWMAAINTGADWVQCVTWNDFSESGQVCPYTDATLNGAIGTAFYDLTAYYAAWFITGIQPAITQDVLYWIHRLETASSAHLQPDGFTAVGGPEEDSIELLAFLTAPGALQITINGVTHTQAAPTGITSFKVPLSAGIPVFTLQRNGSNVFSGRSVQIHGPEGLPSGVLDMTYWGGSITKAGATAYGL